MNEDDDLRAMFRALRAHDEATTAPSFEATRPRIPARRKASRPRWAWAGATAAVLLVIWVARLPGSSSQEDTAATLPSWPTTTVSLLADAGDPPRYPAWGALPTADLGRTSLHPPKEVR